jgi:hypothetical protein
VHDREITGLDGLPAAKPTFAFATFIPSGAHSDQVSFELGRRRQHLEQQGCRVAAQVEPPMIRATLAAGPRVTDMDSWRRTELLNSRHASSRFVILAAWTQSLG